MKHKVNESNYVYKKFKRFPLKGDMDIHSDHKWGQLEQNNNTCDNFDHHKQVAWSPQSLTSTHRAAPGLLWYDVPLGTPLPLGVDYIDPATRIQPGTELRYGMDTVAFALNASETYEVAPPHRSFFCPPSSHKEKANQVEEHAQTLLSCLQDHSRHNADESHHPTRHN